MKFIAKEYNRVTFCTFLEVLGNFEEVGYKFPPPPLFFFFF